MKGHQKLKYQDFRFYPQFEALKMAEDETIVEFNVRVLDLANESFALGEKFTDTKMVREVLRSLRFRFNMKATTIKEANDITTMKLDELFGSLKTFELSLEDNVLKKKIVFHSKG